jgi:hypothetical protein
VKLTRASLWAGAAVLSLVPIVAMWLQEFLAVDACLDRGGSFNYVAGQCDLIESHAYVAFSARHGLAIALSVVAAAILSVGFLVLVAAERALRSVPGDPYNWRTWLRTILPSQLAPMLPKGADCEAIGSSHAWYNSDNEHSACYHCNVVRSGQLWSR